MSQPKIAKRIRYYAYKARTQAEKIARAEGFADDLYGFSARGAAILWSELNKAGIESKIVSNPGHIFCYVSGYYVDITATQFGLGRTMVRKEASVERLNAKPCIRHGERIYPDWSMECAWKTFSGPQSLQAWQVINKCSVEVMVKMEDLTPPPAHHYIRNYPANYIETS